MAIKITYRCGGKHGKRYVRKAVGANNYQWCVQDAKKPQYDVMQGTCEASDLPPDIVTVCNNYSGSFYACEWPK